jgi:hypothetical protein
MLKYINLNNILGFIFVYIKIIRRLTMIKLILNPYEGVGNIKIGMTKDDISNVLNITPKTFMKSEDEFVDDFKMMHVYYNDQHKSIAFEIFPEIEVKFKGINLTKNKIEIVKKAFEKYDNNIEVDEYGFTSYKYGFNIYGDSEEVESLFVFENGYYNK